MLNNAVLFIAVTCLSLILSFIFDRRKTIQGVRKGLKMFFGMAPPFINILILVSVLLYLIPEEVILRYLGPESGLTGFFMAAIVGSITLIPGLISYPLAAALLKQGATYAVVAVFMTTLMMVGVVTLPLEIKYFGKKAAILRNFLNLFAALIIGVLMGWLM